MKSNTINNWVRLVVLVCGLLLFPVIKLPMWRIELTAPQYPEGLILKIYPYKLGGDVAVVNGLNHYIGMKTLHAEDFIEFTVLPYLVGFFGLLFIAIAALNRRTGLYILTGLFMAFAILAMADFWRWEYDYGHNLDPNAAIQVPGMSYQPPFLGYKQLLNFGAFSIPDSGGWIFFSAGVLLLGCTITQIVLSKKKGKHFIVSMTLVPALALGLNACSNGVQPLKTGKDACSFCKMILSDKRFGAEAITSKGKVYKFDDIQCMVNLIKGEGQNFENANFYFTDFEMNHSLLKSSECFLLKSDELNSPMNGNTAAFSSQVRLQNSLTQYPGKQIDWNELLK